MPKLKEELQFTSQAEVIKPKYGASLYYKDGSFRVLRADGTEYVLGTASTDGNVDLSQYYTKSEISQLLADLGPTGFEVVTATELPSTGDSGKLYVVDHEEYLYINDTWELIGSTEVDLSGYAKTSDIPTNLSQLVDDIGHATKAEVNTKANITDVYTKEEVDSMIDQVYTKEEVDNKVNSNGNKVTFKDWTV